MTSLFPDCSSECNDLEKTIKNNAPTLLSARGRGAGRVAARRGEARRPARLSSRGRRVVRGTPSSGRCE